VTADQLALVMPGDRTDPHADARRLVRDAIEVTAALHGGIVSANAVRVRLVCLDVPPKVIGQVYAALRREGHLRPEGLERSNDTRGGNAGRWIDTYKWVERP